MKTVMSALRSGKTSAEREVAVAELCAMTSQPSAVELLAGILEQGGVGELFGRGLQTRLLTNIMQSMVFSVAWKAIEEELSKGAAK